jgi:hypothetical protein
MKMEYLLMKKIKQLDQHVLVRAVLSKYMRCPLRGVPKSRAVKGKNNVIYNYTGCLKKTAQAITLLLMTQMKKMIEETKWF